ncbi:MAG: NADH-quinone oxidoreductase subunit N [Gemmatimonadetes bacterium]|nr:NADH-quinone oxidoreductase subunit N [Gemmatimonadota bacterium]
MSLDFTRSIHFFWALLPELVLSAWALLVLLVDVWQRGSRSGPSSPTIAWLSLAGVLLAGVANGWLYRVVEAVPTSMVAVDGFRLFANWVFLLSAALTILISFGYLTRQGLRIGEFYVLVLLATVGMMFMAGSRDLILIFLGLEVMSVAVYVLSALNRRDRKSSEAGLKYFLLGAFSTGFFLYGIALVYGATGTTNLVLMSVSIGVSEPSGALLLLGIGLLAIGFGFKVSAVPFHMWTPDVYEGAPTPITAFMAAGVKAAAFAALLRVFVVAFGEVYESWYLIVWWLAAVTMVVANLIALVQSNVKRMLAYSSIAHAGYLLVALVAANELGLAAMLFYLLIYTLMNIGAFAIVISVAHQGEERLDTEDYAGLGWQRPVLATLLTIFLLSLAGFPGTGGFMGKIYLLQAAADAKLWTLAVVLVLTTLLSYWYYLRVAWYMWMREAPSPDAHSAVVAPLPMRVALVIGAGGVVVLGVFPDAALECARASVSGLMSASAAVLGLAR